MTLQYFGHPFSSYTWKGEIALIEKGVDYEFRNVDPAFPDNGAELQKHSPTGKFPLLLDGDKAVFESSIVIEYLDHKYSQAPKLIPDDPEAALQVRLMDRMFDNHVMGNGQAVVNEHIPLITEKPDQNRIDRGKAGLSSIYGWLDKQLEGLEWATPYGFTLADCAAAPSLFYADWLLEIPEELANLKAYRARLLARPSVKQVVDAARPYRHYFPVGAPDRD